MHHVAGQIFGRPHYLHPQRAEMIMWSLRERLGLELPEPDRQASAFFGQPARSGMYRIENGAAIIPITATLVNRGGWIGAQSGLVSYEGLAAQVREALDDDDVERIVLDIDSPGGMMDGALLLAEQLSDARQQKPLTAVVNDLAASAGYLLAAQADEIVISPTSRVGSIGVIYIHAEYSRALEQSGIGVSIIAAGAHKADGNPYEPLPDDVRADIQRSVDRAWELFIEAVHAGRPSLSPAAMRAMEARVYEGQEAIEAGLADRIGKLEDVIMSKKQTEAPAPAAGKEMKAREITADDYVREAVQAERARIAAILDADEAKGREALARKLALTTGMEPAQAIEVLAAAPRQQAKVELMPPADDAGLGLELATAAPSRKEAAMESWERVLQRTGMLNAD